jgi:hypothetical protein
MRAIQKYAYSFEVLEREWKPIEHFIQRTSKTCNQQNEIYSTTLDQMFHSLQQKTLDLQHPEIKPEQKRIPHKDKIIIQLQGQIEKQKQTIEQLTIQNERLAKLYKGCQIILSASYHKGVKSKKKQKQRK